MKHRVWRMVFFLIINNALIILAYHAIRGDFSLRDLVDLLLK